MSEDIFVDIPRLKVLATRLNGNYTKLCSVIRQLGNAKKELGKVYQDPSFEEFETRFETGLDHLDDLKVVIDSIEQLCYQVCEEYSAADKEILSLF